MKATRQRVQVRAAAGRRKKEENKAKRKEGASSSTLKAVRKGTPKRKADGKDDHPPKKVSITLGDKLPKKPSPPKPRQGINADIRSRHSGTISLLTRATPLR